MAQHRLRYTKPLWAYCECGWVEPHEGIDAGGVTKSDGARHFVDHLDRMAVDVVVEEVEDPDSCVVVYLMPNGDQLPCIKAFGHSFVGDAERDGEARKHQAEGGRKWM